MATEILVVREKDVFSSILIEKGFSVINFPVIKIESLADLTELEKFLNELEMFDGIFITSAKAAEIVSEKLKETGKFFCGKFYVLGKRSADLLENSGEIFFDENATTAEELLRLVPNAELKNKKFLFPRGNRSLRVVPEALDRFAEVVETIVYNTTEIETDETKSVKIKEKIERGEIAAVCFFSPSGVEGFLKQFENFAPGKIKIAAIGQTTARRVEANNLKVNFVSAKPSASDFATDFAEYLRKGI